MFVISRKLLVAVGVVCAGVAALNTPVQCREKVLYSFQGGKDGLAPYGSLTADNSGNLYGTTAGGGGGTGCPGNLGCGTVFKIAAAGTESVLYAFKGGNDGAFPRSTLVADSAANFYGTTSEGGASNAGTVFELAPDGTETVLYAFTGGSDGWGPNADLAMDGNGNLYGTTVIGGDVGGDCAQFEGCGTVFKVAKDGTETVLHTFQTGSDGFGPGAGVIRDGSGNLYGVTANGGTGTACGSFGCGTIFKLAPDGTYTVLYSFQGGTDTAGSDAKLMMDAAGNLYGTGGGGAYGRGTVFRLAPDGTETVLHSFAGGSDGYFPLAGVIMDKVGNLYGTTAYGGDAGCKGSGCGTVFELAPDGTESILYAFKLFLKGTHPVAALLKGPNGLLFGTASAGGAYHDGVVFSVKK